AVRYPPAPAGARAGRDGRRERPRIENLRGGDLSGTHGPSPGRRRGEPDVAHRHGPDAGVIEAPQDRTHVELARPAQIDEELDGWRHGLPELARELVSACLTLRVGLPRQQ